MAKIKSSDKEKLQSATETKSKGISRRSALNLIATSSTLLVSAGLIPSAWAAEDPEVLSVEGNDPTTTTYTTSSTTTTSTSTTTSTTTTSTSTTTSTTTTPVPGVVPVELMNYDIE